MHDAPWDGRFLQLDEVGGALAVCSNDGRLLGVTPSARELLGGLGIDASTLPCALPDTLWSAIAGSPRGNATEWSPEGQPDAGCLGCTGYEVGARHLLLLMREVSEKQRDLAQKLHRQRLESIGRLIAAMAHDLRASLLPIVFHADALRERIAEMPREEVSTALLEMATAASSMRKTLDVVLDYARVGPPVVGPVSLGDVVARATAIVRPLLREGAHKIAIAVEPGADWVFGHPLAVEHVIVNLLLNAMEATPRGACMQIIATTRRGTDRVLLRVEDDGPGVPAHLRARLFEPFFTTKTEGTGLGLSSSREAIRDLGGELSYEPLDRGSAFVITLGATVAP